MSSRNRGARAAHLRRATSRLLVGVTTLGVGLALVAPAASAEDETTATAAASTVLVSSSSSGVPGNRPGDRPQISGNGRYVTFDSASTNLVPGVTTQVLRVYRKDLWTGDLQLVNRTDGDAASNEWASFTWPDHSGDLVAFVSDATDLAAVRTTSRSVFVRDLAAGTTELISVGIDGRAATGASSRPMMSRSGRYVAFSSFGSNLSTAGGNGQEQVYLRDRQTGRTTLVSSALGGGLGNARSYRGMVSDDGRYVAWASSATNLVAGAQVNGESIFLRDLATGTTRRVSVRSDGAPAGGSRPYLSPDARSVVFNSYSPIAPDDNNGLSDVYTLDVPSGRMTRESVSVSGGDGSDEALRGFVTDDSRYFVFNSFSENLVPDDRNGRGDVFIRDRSSGVTSLLSRNTAGGGANGQSFRPVPDADGSVVTYLSEARNLVAGDTSSGFQVYAASTDGVGQPPPPADTAAPSVVVDSPTAGSRLTSRSVVLRGSSSDDRGVERGFVQVRDNDSGQWLREDGTWGSGARRLPVTLGAPGATSTGWRYALDLPDGRYGFDVQTIDAAGNASAKPFTSFTVDTAAPDTTAPTVTPTSPAARSTVAGPQVTFRGNAGDDVGVRSVFVQVRNNATNQWLRPDGTWGAGARRIPATVEAVGATRTTWSLAADLPRGSYGFDVQSQDAAGNVSTKPFTSFTVS